MHEKTEIKNIPEFRSVLDKAKQILKSRISETNFVVDATAGNGNDMLFLCELAPKGHVFGFDIQIEAVSRAEKLLKENGKSNYTIFLASHDLIGEYLKDYQGKISAVLFNLGYLPGGDKSITTKTETTIRAINAALKLLKENGIVLIVVYPHNEGKKEGEEIMKLKSKVSCFNIFRNTDNINAPYLITLEN